MADNVNITEGTGTVIATDQVGTTHFQKVKLVDGTAESTTVIAAGGGVEAGALRVTIASDSTGVVSVDDNGGALTVDGTVTANLAAGTNNIGDVDVLSIASGDNNIGNVDIASAIPAGTNLIGKVGIDQLTANANEVVVKSGTVTAVTSITNVVHVDDNSSTLSIDDGAGSITVDGSVTSALSSSDAENLTAIRTAVEVLDNAISGSEMQVDIVASLPAGTNAIGKLASNTGVDIGDVDILSIAAGDNNIGNVDIVTVPAPLNVTGGGTEASAIRVTIASDSTGVLSVDDNGSALTVDGSVTAVLSTTDAENLTAIRTAVEVIDNAISGSEMQVDVVAALPAGTNNIGDVDILSIAAGTNNIGDMDIITMPLGGYSPSTDLYSACSTDITGTAATEIIPAPGSGKYFHMTSALVTNGDSTVGTFVTFYTTTDATGTAILSGYAASAGGGFSATFPAPINCGDNKPVYVKCETDSSTTRVVVAGFIK